MNKIGWGIFAGIVIILIGGLVWYSKASNPSVDVSSVNPAEIQSASSVNGQIADHVEGNTDAKVKIIEYGDYECPYCGEAYAPMKTIVSDYGDQVAFIFRNFPLTTVHPNARAAAAVAEAAGLQGKYWQMHDKLYEGQNDWGSLTDGTKRDSIFKGYAEEIGLNIDQYTKDLSGGAKAVNQKISFDQAIAKKLNLQSTPTFYINGNKVDDNIVGAMEQGSSTEFTKLIDQALGK